MISALYLGRYLDDEGRLTEEPVAYPPDHLTTHALLLGMTGSGKTGLGLILVEEALQQGIPALLLDVKGDLANLLLTFPALAPTDFEPWVDADSARRQGQLPMEAATTTAEHWRAGLAAWGLGPEQVARLRAAADFVLYTPGARHGRPVDLLARFSAPPPDDADEAALRAQGLASALLGLAGVEADPLRSREHILLTTLIRHAWEQGGALELPALIQLVQRPPMQQVGVFDLESFFPHKERFDLALTLNNLIAAPGFALWRTGEPLALERLLYAPDGRPRAAVFYLAHLPEEQRQFFITLFLEEVRSWVRRSAGTQMLRALLYFDELYGYLPPYPANPPTKAPLLALVKQARAAGLGLVLATQNPADLDYKGLGNIGTWCVGVLRTDRDRMRVLEGMEGSLGGAGRNAGELTQTLSRLKPREFLLHDTRAGLLRFFQSRWALSYLRGPLTPAEVKRLAAGGLGAGAPESRDTTPLGNVTFTAAAPLIPASVDVSDPHLADFSLSQLAEQPPAVDPAIPQVFLAPTITAQRAAQGATRPVDPAQAALVFRPALLGASVLHFFHEKAALSLTRQQTWRLTTADETWSAGWEQAELVIVRAEDLAAHPPASGTFAPLPGALGRPAAYKRWEQTLRAYLLRTAALTLWYCEPLKSYSRPEEGKRAFLERCRAEAERRKRDELATVKTRFEKQMARVQEKIRREELEMQGEEEELEERKREQMYSGAESVWGLVTGRAYMRPLSHVSRQRRMVKEVEADIEESVQALKVFRAEAEQIQDEWEAAAQTVAQKWDSVLEQLREVVVRPRQQDVEIRFCGLAWFPYWEYRVETDRDRLSLPAYVPL